MINFASLSCFSDSNSPYSLSIIIIPKFHFDSSLFLLTIFQIQPTYHKLLSISMLSSLPNYLYLSSNLYLKQLLSHTYLSIFNFLSSNYEFLHPFLLTSSQNLQFLITFHFLPSPIIYLTLKSQFHFLII